MQDSAGAGVAADDGGGGFSGIDVYALDDVWYVLARLFAAVSGGRRGAGCDEAGGQAVGGGGDAADRGLCVSAACGDIAGCVCFGGGCGTDGLADGTFADQC